MSDERYNLSRQSMWMNETAYPGSAINTIGFRLYFPETAPEAAAEAVREAVKDIGLFRKALKVEDDVPALVPGNAPMVYTGGAVAVPSEMDSIWESGAQRPMKGELYRFTVYPLMTGGSFLTAFFHHILLDGWSMCQTAQRILDQLNHKPLPSVPDMPMKGDTREPDDGDFWLQYFDELQAEPQVLYGTPRGTKRQWYRHCVPEALQAKLEAYAADTGVTVPSVFSAALSLYLARAARTKDAVFLMPRLNRDSSNARKAFGCRTLVVPVRVTVDDDMSFDALCRLAHAQAAEASAHKHTGIDAVFSKLKNAGITNGSLTEYVLNYYSTELVSEIPFEIRMSMDGEMHNHLTVNITRFNGNIEILYDARCGIYDEETTRFFHESLMHLIEQGIAGEMAVGCFTLPAEAEQARLETVRGKEIALDDTATIPSLFQRAAQLYADRPALYAGDVSYTFSELDAVSNRIANALIRRGIGAEQFVMHKLKRDHRLIPAMLGILKAGAAFIPVDPNYPADRIAYIQQNSGAAALIEDADFIPSETAECALLDIDELMAYPDASDPCAEIPQTQIAYSIYTSGTTGRPKGVLLSHRGIVNITDPDNNPFNRDIMTCGTGLVATGSVCFDISLFEFFVPLLNGMFIEFAPEDAMADAVKLASLIDRHGANMLHCTPSRIAAYLRNEVFAAALHGVEAILAAGEALPGSLVDTLRDVYGVRVFNGYGPTETTIGATVSEAGDNKTIGRPIANMGILVLDDKKRQVPFGAIGELYVYGAGVGIGYRDLPDMTRDRFITAFGRRLYKTGDLGRCLPDGCIAYHGRNDQQVKIRGLRIELPEIESSMLAFEGVGAACVQVRKIQGSEHLVGFYSAREGSSVDKDALLAHLKGRLTFYMVPDILTELDAIPQTPGGKTDQRAVAAIPVAYVRTYRAPQNPIEKAVCEAMQKVLGQEKVGLDDNFFTIGGDSLYTAELIFEIESRLPGVTVTHEDIFKYPIPEYLAQYLYRGRQTERKTENPLAALDYTGVADILSGNTLGGDITLGNLGNVLLTGATGFLGMHVLSALSAMPGMWKNIYCLVRPTRRQNSERRLRGVLVYYEEDACADLVGERIFAYNGDITSPEILTDAPEGLSIDTVINCAANVSHFAYDDKLERVNTEGVANLIAFCEKQGARLVQVSTISVGGITESAAGKALTLTEKDLYIGQQIRNQYIRSKYMAEYEMLKAAATGRVHVKIMRVGNLQGRISDGEFQLNRNTNAFTRQIASYVRIGKVPESLMQATVNFSPVDDTAHMIAVLSALPDRYTAFHVYPKDEVPFRAMFAMLASIGHDVQVVPDEEFEREIDMLNQTREGRSLTEGLLVEKPDLTYVSSEIDHSFTCDMLDALGQQWNPVTDTYLDRYFTALAGLNMFDREEDE